MADITNIDDVFLIETHLLVIFPLWFWDSKISSKTPESLSAFGEQYRSEIPKSFEGKQRQQMIKQTVVSYKHPGSKLPASDVADDQLYLTNLASLVIQSDWPLPEEKAAMDKQKALVEAKYSNALRNDQFWVKPPVAPKRSKSPDRSYKKPQQAWNDWYPTYKKQRVDGNSTKAVDRQTFFLELSKARLKLGKDAEHLWNKFPEKWKYCKSVASIPFKWDFLEPRAADKSLTGYTLKPANAHTRICSFYENGDSSCFLLENAACDHLHHGGTTWRKAISDASNLDDNYRFDTASSSHNSKKPDA